MKENRRETIKKEKNEVRGIIAATGILAFFFFMGILFFSVLYKKTQVSVKDPAESMCAGQLEADTESRTETEAEKGSETELETVQEKESETDLETESVLETECNTETEDIVPESQTEEQIIEILAVGDNLIHAGIAYQCRQADGTTYVMDYLYAYMADMVKEADVAILNQEVPCGGDEIGISGYPSFNAPKETLMAAWNCGFNVLTLATNHTFDKNHLGLEKTIGYLKTNLPGMLYSGAWLSEEERETIPVIEKKGVRMAVLDYTYGTNAYQGMEGVNYIDRDRIARDVEKAKQVSDYLIVCMHWGLDSVVKETPEQLDLAQYLADLDVDLVIGTHPHVVQHNVVLTGKNGHQTIVYYSLGNFISLQHVTNQMLGGIAKVYLRVTENGPVVDHWDYDFDVTYFDQEHGNCKVYPWELFTRELAESHGVKQFDTAFSYDALAAIVEKYRIKRE